MNARTCFHASAVLIWLLGSAPAADVAPPSSIPKIQAELRARQFKQAAAHADAALAANEANADELWLLKASALLHDKQAAAAVQAVDAALAHSPRSPWRHKWVFLKAQALVEQRQFAQAAAIYASESTRILAPERKQSLVGEILRFAEKLQTKPPTPDSPKPDYQKAYSLYTKALAMELPRALRDDIILQRARAIQLAGNPAQAVKDLQAYLTEYDPLWTGPAGSGSERLPMQNPPPAGKHVALARYRLAEAFHQSGNVAAARMELEDLMKMIAAPAPDKALAAELAGPDGRKLPGEIRWLTVQTYFGPDPDAAAPPVAAIPQQQQTMQMLRAANLPANLNAPASAHIARASAPVRPNVDQAVRACRDYLQAHPEGTRAIRAAWMIADALQSAGRTDDAIGAYREFIAAKGFRLPAGEAAHAKDEEIHDTPAAYLDQLKMRALFRIGRLFATQKKHAEAIATWQTYIKDFPNGPEWSESQSAIIESEFQIAFDALTAKQEDLAMQRFQEFLRAHPLDERAPRILYLFGALHEAKALDIEAAKQAPADTAGHYRKAIEEWSKLISKHPETAEARTAMLRSGALLEEKLGDYDKALTIYQKLSTERSDAAAAASMARLTQKALALSVPRVFRTHEKPTVHLQLRNIESCEIRIYKIDLQAYFRKMHGITGVESLDVSLIQPDKSWTFKPEGYAKCKPLKQDIEIPFADGEAGACLVTAADEDWESTVLVLRSNLEVIVKSSRREVLAFVQDMVSGKPADQVDLLVSTGSEVAATGKTGADGVFKTSLDKLKDLNDVRVFAARAGHAAAYNLPLAGLQLSSGLTAKGYLYTDRPAYQPGESVGLRGILREVRNDQYALPENTRFTIRLNDPQGRLLSEQVVQTGKFGTFDATLALPPTAATGRYVVTASQQNPGKPTLNFEGAFEVRELLLEKIKLTMDFPRRVWFRGDVIDATLTCRYAWGEALPNRVLRCILPDRRLVRVTTDAEGQAALKFDTTGMTPGTPLTFTATLEADNLTTTETLTLARLGFSIAATPSQPAVIAGEPFDLAITTTGADGKPLGADLKVRLLRMEPAPTIRLLSLLPWPQPGLPSSSTTVETEHQTQTTPDTGKTTLPLKLDKAGNYLMEITGSDRAGQTIRGEARVEVSGDLDAVKLRWFADKSTLKVGEETKVRLHSRLEKGLALVTYEGETILRYQILELHKDYNDLTFATGNELFPNFRLAVAAMDGRELRSTAKNFTVERELQLTLKPLQDAFLPGAEGKFEITATDQTGKPVEAELSLALINDALYDASPDLTPPVLRFFQDAARRHAEFHTGATCGFQYAGTTRPVPKAIVDESKRIERAAADRNAIEAIREQMRSSFASVTGPVVLLTDTDASMQQVEQPDGTMAGSFTFTNDLDVTNAPADIPARPNGGGGGAVTARREVRGEGRWLPTIVTGADGKTVATLQLPDTITAWRLTARGCTVESLVGQTTAHTLTRKDFFVDLKTPPFLMEGDELRVVARIHNLTHHAGPAALTLRVMAAADRSNVLATREQTASLAAKQGAEVTFAPLDVPNTPALVFEVTAVSGPMTDRIEHTLPVQPRGIAYAVHGGGTASADAAVTLQLPGSRKYRSQWLTLTVGPDVKTTLLDMALQEPGVQSVGARILPPPWGGHPAHDLLAVANALAYANSGEVHAHYAVRLAERGRALVASLVSSQAADGTWPGTTMDPYITARAYWALVSARRAGLSVHKETLEKAAAALLKQLEGFDANDNDSKAIVLHALSWDQRADFAACNRLYRDRNALGAATLALLTRAFHNIERKEIAAELAGLLEAKAAKDAAAAQVFDPGYKLPGLNDVPETTALVLMALAESKPDSPAAARAAQALLRDHGGSGFSTARAHGPAVAALAAWFGPGKQQATDMEISVLVNGREIKHIKATAQQPLVTLEAPAEALKPDRNLVEFKMTGRATYAYGATLTGFADDTKASPDNIHPRIDEWSYLHAPLEYRGRPIAVGSTSVVKHLESGQRVHVKLADHHGYWGQNRWFVLDIPLPAGARLVPGSVTVGNNARAEIRPDLIRVSFANQHCPAVNYVLTGYAPGKYRLLPPVIREIGNPSFLSVGPAQELTVLAAGEPSPDRYVMNLSERFALGQCHFNDGEDAKALEYLHAVFKENPKYNESDLARMLLWIYTKPGFYDAARIVDMFEILRERFPTLEIPFDKILVCGKAYQDLGEHERAWLVYRAVISASFTNDSGISAVLEDEGRFLGSIDFQERVWREYPDTAEVVSSYFALSQLLYQKSAKAHELPKEDHIRPNKPDMLRRTTAMLVSFLALYPGDPLADDAGFSLCNGMLDLKDYPRVVTLSREFAQRYAGGELAPSFQYMTALGLFWQKQHAEALAAARVIADGTSKDRDFARYIVGQIYHAQSKPAEAIEWYAKVKDLYADAAEAIAYFEKKNISAEEVTVAKPGTPVAMTLKYRNIKDVFVQVYRVDLMKLYLQQKNLSAITSVQLAGIKPEAEQMIPLGDGKDYVEKERVVPLPMLKDEAAYLVICRGDDLFTSGMVLITPLKIEAQEDSASGRLRANVLDTASGGYRAEVHVKAIGSADQEFRSGETDLRGLFIATPLRGKATVIAREGTSRYAFFRGTTWLGTPENTPATQPAQPAAIQQDVDYQGNLFKLNDSIQFRNQQEFDSNRRQAPNKGVKAGKAK